MTELVIEKIVPPVYFKTKDGNRFNTYAEAQTYLAEFKRLHSIDQALSVLDKSPSARSIFDNVISQLHKSPESAKALRNALTELVDFQNQIAKRKT